MKKPGIRLLRKADVMSCISYDDAVGVVREGLEALANSQVESPDHMTFHFPDRNGEAHVKGAYIKGSQFWTVKVGTGFYDNPDLGLPAGSGGSIVASAEDGFIQTIILDDGYLTDLRTGITGALAASALCTTSIEKLCVVGCGTQAGFQLEMTLRSLTPESIHVFGRNPEKARAFVDRMSGELDRPLSVANSIPEALDGADLIITTTPAKSPLVMLSDLDVGAAIVAMGSDTRGKQELDPQILERAQLVTSDDPGQARHVGESQYLDQDVGDPTPLGDLLAGRIDAAGLSGIRVADLVGTGVEDAAVAGKVSELAESRGVGALL